MYKQTNKKALLLLAIIISICSNGILAQTKLSILYKHGNIKGSLADYLKPNNPVKWSGKFSIDEFIINDTITSYETAESFEDKDEYTIKGVRKSRRNKTPGKAFIPNSSYCNYFRGTSIDAIEWKDENYFVKDVIENKQKIWNLTEDVKSVYGYPCKQASLIKDGETEVIIWYTENFKCSLSATGDTSLPGTILETYYPKSGMLITAIDLQIETNAVLMPAKGGVLITRQEFDKIQKNKRK